MAETFFSVVSVLSPRGVYLWLWRTLELILVIKHV
jgi:hypothetical protein